MVNPCPQCGHVWWDTEAYVRLLSRNLPEKPRVVLDIGCGNKGVIAQYYWKELGIEKGYACDRHVVKRLPAPWEPLVMDAEDLLDKLGPKSVDFVTHCGLLEHIGYEKALRVLHVIEQICRGTVFFTSSAVLREVDYKVKRDGNPFHYYKSFWCGPAYETLGYTIDRRRMQSGQTFCEEVVGWAEMSKLEKCPWEDREERAKFLLTMRACVHCECEPMFWDVKTGDYLCVRHALATGRKEAQDLQGWIDRDGEGFAGAPFRETREVIGKEV